MPTSAGAITDAGIPPCSLGLTAFFVVAVVVLEFLLGFLVALMLNTVERMKPVYYGILLCPLLMNPVVVGLIWRMFLHPTLGIVNYLLGVVGVAPVNWLGSTNVALMDHHHGRHLAPGLLHGRSAARGALRLAARAL